MLKLGDKAPLEIKVQDHEGKTVTLKDYLKKRTIVYFYPKDDTHGCTKEACGIRDSWHQFEKLGVPVLGVSPDNGKSHLKFISKYDLPFTLLSDPEHQLAEAFGAWGEKKNYGKTYMGIIRSTFILDENGKIIKAFPKVKAEGHAAELLAALAEL